MNRSFKPTSRSLRSVLAVFAAAVTALIVGSIEGLVQHYDVAAQVAALPAIVVAAR